ncbi:MAG: GNAT family N-acetyltransferase [Rhodospirillales bacterium]|nr:GNAT family N-acetyltransferase [Rhodospirillales bacterium]
MIDLITSQNASHYGHLLREMFRLRHRIFKEQLGWSVECNNGEERDQFDRPDTAYLIVSDETQNVIGAWRLLPTTRPYMASTVFRALFGDVEPPQAESIWECSRFVVNPPERHVSVSGIDEATASLLVGITEFAVSYNVREIISVETPAVARLHARARGRAPVWRSSVQSLGETRALVARYDIDGGLLQSLREKYRTQAPIIRQMALWDQSVAA